MEKLCIYCGLKNSIVPFFNQWIFSVMYFERRVDENLLRLSFGHHSK